MILLSLTFADHPAFFFFVSVGDMMKDSFDHIHVILYLMKVYSACLHSFWVFSSTTNVKITMCMFFESNLYKLNKLLTLLLN